VKDLLEPFGGPSTWDVLYVRDGLGDQARLVVDQSQSKRRRRGSQRSRMPTPRAWKLRIIVLTAGASSRSGIHDRARRRYAS